MQIDVSYCVPQSHVNHHARIYARYSCNYVPLHVILPFWKVIRTKFHEALVTILLCMYWMVKPTTDHF